MPSSSSRFVINVKSATPTHSMSSNYVFSRAFALRANARLNTALEPPYRRMAYSLAWW